LERKGVKGADITSVLHHAWSKIGFIVNRSIIRLRSIANRLFLSCHKLFSMVFGTGSAVRPWHWRWSYEAQVLNPLQRDLCARNDAPLLVRDYTMPDISLSSLDDCSTLQSASVNQAIALLQLQRHGHILLSRHTILTRNPDLARAVEAKLDSERQFRLTSLDGRVTVEMLHHMLGPNISIEMENSYGSGATALVVDTIRQLRQAPLFVWLFSFLSEGSLIRRILCFPILFSVALLTFPLISILIFLMDQLGIGATRRAATTMCLVSSAVDKTTKTATAA
jgi:hypothetical protein